MFRPSSPAWWVTVVAAIGALVAAWAAPSPVGVIVAGFVACVYVRGYHATQIAEMNAAAAVGAAKQQTAAIAEAVRQAVTEHLTETPSTGG